MNIGVGRSSKEILDKAQAFTENVSGKRGDRAQVIEDSESIYVHVANERASTVLTYDRRTGEYGGTSTSRP